MSLSRTRLKTPLTALVTALTAAMFCLSPLAHADALQDIGKAMKQGQYPQALERVDQYLTANPKEPQGRFLKGLILTEMNRQNEAIVIFTKLTEEFPESPEPYNNLAVIYAQQKQYDKARQALEMAIRTHPSYATAHENLGDIYAHMASQAYDKALSIDSSNTSAQTKLAMIRDMMTGTPGSKPAGSKASSRTVAAAASAAPAARATPAAPVPAPTAMPAPTVTKPAAASLMTPAASSATAAAVAPTEPGATPPAAADSKAIQRMVEDWAAAWSKKDVSQYLSYYARDFALPGRQSRAAWEAERRKRIDKPGNIQISVDELDVSMDGPDRATVRFRQHYQAPWLKSSSNKTLVLIKHGGYWQIKQERVRR